MSLDWDSEQKKALDTLLEHTRNELIPFRTKLAVGIQDLWTMETDSELLKDTAAWMQEHKLPVDKELCTMFEEEDLLKLTDHHVSLKETILANLGERGSALVSLGDTGTSYKVVIRRTGEGTVQRYLHITMTLGTSGTRFVEVGLNLAPAAAQDYDTVYAGASQEADGALIPRQVSNPDPLTSSIRAQAAILAAKALRKALLSRLSGEDSMVKLADELYQQDLVTLSGPYDPSKLVKVAEKKKLHTLLSLIIDATVDLTLSRYKSPTYSYTGRLNTYELCAFAAALATKNEVFDAEIVEDEHGKSCRYLKVRVPSQSGGPEREVEMLVPLSDNLTKKLTSAMHLSPSPA